MYILPPFFNVTNEWKKQRDGFHNKSTHCIKNQGDPPCLLPWPGDLRSARHWGLVLRQAQAVRAEPAASGTGSPTSHSEHGLQLLGQWTAQSLRAGFPSLTQEALDLPAAPHPSATCSAIPAWLWEEWKSFHSEHRKQSWRLEADFSVFSQSPEVGLNCPSFSSLLAWFIHPWLQFINTYQHHLLSVQIPQLAAILETCLDSYLAVTSKSSKTSHFLLKI